MLQGVEPRGIDTNELGLRSKQRPRPRREVFQSRADSKNDIGLAHHLVCGVGPRHSDRARVIRVVGKQRGLSGNGFDDGDSVLFGKSRKLCFGERIVDTTASDDCGPFRGAKNIDRPGELPTVWSRTRSLVDSCLKERFGVVEGIRRDVLGQTDERRSTVTGIQHRGHGLRQRTENLCGVGDAIPIPNDRLERVIHRDGRGSEMLDLL